MDDQQILHEKLVAAFPGVQPYFTPGSQLTLSYPCIVYDVETLRVTYAEDVPYVIGTIFEVTMIAPIPGYSDKKQMFRIPYTEHLRTFTTDDLVHDVYRVHVNHI